MECRLDVGGCKKGLYLAVSSAERIHIEEKGITDVELFWLPFPFRLKTTARSAL